MMEGILVASIITNIIAGLGAVGTTAMYVIYRCTGGRKSFLWYICHL